MRASSAGGPQARSSAVTLRACPRPASLSCLGAFPSCSVTQLCRGLKFGNSLTSSGPTLSRGLQPPPGTPLPGPVALGRGLPLAEPQFPLARVVSAHPRGCGEPSNAAPVPDCVRKGQGAHPGSGVESPPCILSRDLGQRRSPLWPSVALLQKEERSTARIERDDAWGDLRAACIFLGT